MLAYWFNRSKNFKSRVEEWLVEKGVQEEALLRLMPVLRGEDREVKAEFGFQVVKKAIVSFQVNKQEGKMLKLLLIFDKLVDDALYCDQISKIALLPIQMSKSSADQQSSNSLRALRLYWKIIKEKAIIVRDRCHVYQEKRSLRIHHLHRSKTQSIVAQLTTIEAFFDNVFELAYYLQRPATSKEGSSLEEKQVIDYILPHLLHKLLGLYNCQMMANKHIVHKMKELTQGQVVRFKKTVVKFRENCNRFILFIKSHEGVKGFELIHFQEIKVETNEGLLKFIDDYLHSVQSESLQVQLNNLPYNFGKIVVEKKIHHGKNAFNPRLVLKSHLNSKKQLPSQSQEGNPFLNWHNNYSHQFPQKQIMTVDLILRIKLQQSLNSQDGDSCIDNPFTSRCSYDNRSTNVTSNYQVSFASRHEYSINILQRVEFENLYSRFEAKWNH